MRFWSTSYATAIRKGVPTKQEFSEKLFLQFTSQSSALIDRNQIRQAGMQFRALGNDPWLTLKPEKKLKRGWYRVDLKANLPVASKPLLYFNFGQGFMERFACPLHHNGNDYSAIVRSYKPALTLRLDPIDHYGTFYLHSFTVKPVSFQEIYWLRFRQIINTASTTIRAPQNWRNIWRSLRTGYCSTRGFVPLPAHFVPTKYWPSPYQQWIETKEPSIIAAQSAQALPALKDQPLISILMPVFNPQSNLLNEAIKSVVQQTYPNWELCIADDASTLPHVKKLLEKWAARDKRIKLVFRKTNGHISATTNSAFTLATGEWITLLDHDDALTAQALTEVALEINRSPHAQMIYSDEDKIDDHGNRFQPHFKPNFSLDLLRSMNYINHLAVYRSDNIRALGGWRHGFEGSQDYDLNLRIIERIPASTIRHIPKILYHWRATQGSTAVSISEKNYAFENGLKALQSHLTRCQLQASAEPLTAAPYYRVRYHAPAPSPLVSLIIPTKDSADLLEMSIGSILTKTANPNYEIIIINNQSEKPKTFRFFKQLTAENNNIRVLNYDEKFNFSAINNFAAQRAHGSVLGLLNNDIEVISPNWLDEMLSNALRPEIGCVGAKLFYPNGTVQHGGVILGIGSIAGHAHKFFAGDADGYFSRLQVQQNLSAVTAACLMVRKNVYEQVGGLDENLAVAFNDVDFCLRVGAAGYQNVFTPFAQLYHHESISRGLDNTPEKMERFNQEVIFMRSRWGQLLDNDPYYSPNLTLQTEDFALRL